MMKQFLFLNFIPSSGGGRGGPAVTIVVHEGLTGSIFFGSDTDSWDCDGNGTEINNWTEKCQILR